MTGHAPLVHRPARISIHTPIPIPMPLRMPMRIRISIRILVNQIFISESSCRTPVVRAGAETRSAMAFFGDIADYIGADKAYAVVEPTVCRMDEWSFLDRRRKTWQ